MQLEATQNLEVAPGATGTSTIRAARALIGDLTWRLISDADGTIVIAESTTGIVEIDDGFDSGERRYDRQFTAPMTSGRYLAVWRLFDQEISQDVVVTTGADVMFATVDDVATRLGRTLSTEEQGTVGGLLATAAVVIADAAGHDDGWAESLTTVPKMLKLLSIELATRNLQNPNAYSTFRQQVGSYSIEVAQAAPGLVLTDSEVMMVRRAVHGRTTDSVHVDSGFERAQDEYWLRKQTAALRTPSPPETTIA